MKNLLQLAFFILNFQLSISNCSAQADLSKTIMVDGKERTYIIHLPYNYQALKNMPIILALHGSGGKSENTQRLYQLDPLADKYGYIVIYPQAIYLNWNIPGITSYGKIDSVADDVHFLSTLIDTAEKMYNGDSNRVFSTGLSRGGKFSLYLAEKLNHRIKAIAPVCASIPVSMLDTFHFVKPMPVLLINGTLDPLVNYNGGYGRLNVGDHIGEGFYMTPTETLVQKLLLLNACDTAATVTQMPQHNAGDGCQAIKYYYKSNKAPVEFIKVIGGGHTWPGSLQYAPIFLVGNVCRDFSAADEIFSFFNAVK